MLGNHRLVTLTGAGSPGKTRLAIAIANQVAGAFPDGVAFVDLASTSDDEGVASTIASALGLSADLTDAPVERLSTYLSTRTVLCLLDNCEHS